MSTPFIKAQCARLLRQPSAFICGALLIGGCIVKLQRPLMPADCSELRAPGAFGAFVCYTPSVFIFLLPVIAGLVGGITATSRARGEDVVYKMRNLTGPRLALGRLVAGSSAAAICTLVCGLCVITAALLLLPNRPELELVPGHYFTDPPERRPETGLPVPVLWHHAKLANDFVAVLIFTLAAAALAALGNAAGQLFAQPLLALAAPIFFVLSTQLLPLPESIDWITPVSILELYPIGGEVRWYVPGPWRLPLLLGYWSAVLVASVIVVRVVAKRQEARG